MTNPDSDLRKFVRRVDLYAARLNPGLCAVAMILSTVLLAETATRIPALYEQVVTAQDNPQLTSDPTALLPRDIPD
jgi:hypothetical protein